MTREDLINIRNKVDDMNKDLGYMSYETEAPATEDPSTEAPEITEAPETAAPSTDVPATDQPSTDAPTTDTPKKDDSDEDLVIPTTESPATRPPLELQDHDFIGDTDINDVLDDKDSFNKLLNEVYKKGINDARDLVGENILKSVPSIVGNTIDVNTRMMKMNEEFYTSNPDLKPFKKAVASVFEEIASENPGKSYKEWLSMTGEETRKRLELHKDTTQQQRQQSQTSDNDGPPPLPTRKGKGVRQQQPGLSKMQKEIDDMNKAVLGR